MVRSKRMKLVEAEERLFALEMKAGLNHNASDVVHLDTFAETAAAWGSEEVL